MVLYILFTFINIKPEIIFSKNSCSTYNNRHMLRARKTGQKCKHQLLGNGFEYGGKTKDTQTYPTLFSFKETLSAICQLINKDGHFFQVSAYLVSCFIINFIANIYTVLIKCLAEKTGIQPGGNGRVYQLVPFLTNGSEIKYNCHTAMKGSALLQCRSQNPQKNQSPVPSYSPNHFKFQRHIFFIV